MYADKLAVQKNSFGLALVIPSSCRRSTQDPSKA